METLVVPSRVRSAASLIDQNVAKDHNYLHATDSAFCALTDFRQEYAITVDAHSTIDSALADMVRLGVHALLVTEEEIELGDFQVLGLITAYDIERERPHRSLGSANLGVLKTIKVVDVMTPWNELPVVHYKSLQTLTAADVYRMFQGTGLTHLLVIDLYGDECAVARGLLSRATLAKRLRDGRSGNSSQVRSDGLGHLPGSGGEAQRSGHN